jgi:hypothetical protein
MESLGKQSPTGAGGEKLSPPALIRGVDTHIDIPDQMQPENDLVLR